MHKIAVLYDGQCVLCRNSIRMLRALDWFKKFEPIELQQAIQQPRFNHLDYQDLMGAIHIIPDENRVYTGFFGVRYQMRYLPLLWPLLPLLYLPGMNWLGPKIYGWIARRRYAINKLLGNPICEDGYCRIP
ncbi:MAG: hypothetical protein CUN55_12845 [Phototrophicales bacterium]|nr:MAG: hypothetical protein CUN55_12845 [Phototrophicales bacterium]